MFGPKSLYRMALICSVSIAGLVASSLVEALASGVEKAAHGVSAKDLAAAAAEIMEELKEPLASAAELKQSGGDVSQKAEIIALIANAVSKAEGECKWKSNALAVRDAALALAKAGKAKNFAQASGAYAAVEKALGGGAGGGEEMKALDVASLHHVMEEVQSRYAPLRRTTRRSTTFSRAKEQIATDAKVLALLSTVIKTDTGSAKKAKQPQADFEKHCDSMLKACQELAAAAEKGDQKAADTARKALGTSCSACHTSYRPDDI